MEAMIIDNTSPSIGLQRISLQDDETRVSVTEHLQFIYCCSAFV